MIVHHADSMGNANGVIRNGIGFSAGPYFVLRIAANALDTVFGSYAHLGHILRGHAVNVKIVQDCQLSFLVHHKSQIDNSLRAVIIVGVKLRAGMSRSTKYNATWYIIWVRNGQDARCITKIPHTTHCSIVLYSYWRVLTCRVSPVAKKRCMTGVSNRN